MIKIFPGLEEINEFAAQKFIEIGGDAISERGRFAVALSGGSTPKSLYRLLSGENYKDKIDWTKVFFFFGDERNVSPDSEESNFQTANEHLFKVLKISPENIFRWRTEKFKNAGEIAGGYEKTIKNFFQDSKSEIRNPKSFDLIFLGIGDDAHTASLFPYTKALDENEKLAVANFVEQFGSYRLTLTVPAINDAENIIFLVSGENKAEALKKVLQGKFEPEKYPAQNVNPKNGNLLWLIDEQAAKLLDS